jgi:hypothetical protein
MLLVEKDTNLIKHQDRVYECFEDKIIVKTLSGNIDFIFATLNCGNTYIVDAPNIHPFIGNKYMWDGEVKENPDWIEE